MLLAYCWGSGLPGGRVVKYPPAKAADTRHRSLIPGRKDPLEEEMATHSSIPAWRVPWRSPAGYSQCDTKELDTTEHLSTRIAGD